MSRGRPSGRFGALERFEGLASYRAAWQMSVAIALPAPGRSLQHGSLLGGPNEWDWRVAGSFGGIAVTLAVTVVIKVVLDG